MKITPIEIRQKNFEKQLRGYDKDEVTAFLMSLSNEWERMLDDQKELRIKLEQSEKEVQKLREVESSLFKTLKTAEDTGANMVDQANKAAKLHLKETQMNAEAMMREAKSKAKNLIEKSEMEARHIIEEMQDGVKSLEQNYKSLENQRENIVLELKNLSSDILDRIGRVSKEKGAFKLEDHTRRVKELVRASEEMINKENLEIRPRSQKPISADDIMTNNRTASNQKINSEPAKKQAVPTQKVPIKKRVRESKSFFDELDD